MQTSQSIPDLLDAANSFDLAVSSGACRELLNRSSECHNYVPRLVALLKNSNPAISDYAFRTLERIGQPAIENLVQTLNKSEGEFRRLLIGLIAGIAPFHDYFPLLKTEIRDGEIECRYWAANCLGRNYNYDVTWPPEAIELLNDAIGILVSLRDQPEHWAQARLTLKHLGKLPNA